MGIRFDVVCARPEGREMHVDIYEPSGPVQQRTAVLVQHGGGYRVGDRKAMQSRCEVLAGRGFTVLAVEYRLVSEAPWPSQLLDLNAAIRWTRDNAGDLGIDPDRVVLQGHSAGAHLSLMAAGTHGRSDLIPALESEPPAGPVAAVVAYYPPVQLDPTIPLPDLPIGGNPAAFAGGGAADGSVTSARLLGHSATAAAAAAASPITYAGPAFPPTILFHGTDDVLIASAGTVRFSEALKLAGVTCEVHLVAGVDHEFDATPSMTEVCVSTVASFLSRQVIDPTGFIEEEARFNPFAAQLRAAHR